jgi:hypothetical protein
MLIKKSSVAFGVSKAAACYMGGFIVITVMVKAFIDEIG